MNAMTGITLQMATMLAGGAISCLAQGTTANNPFDHADSGRRLFDQETFGGNGRTCVTCHSRKTGTFSIEEAQERFAKDPNDTLFRQPDSDAGDGQTFNRLLATATIKIDLPLAPNAKLGSHPAAGT